VETPLNGHAIDDGLIRQAAEEVDPSDDFYAGVSSRTAILLSRGSHRRSDQQARDRQPEGENRHQALSPGDDGRLGVRRERGDCFSKSAGSLVIEGRRFHCYASRGKTAPEQLAHRAFAKRKGLIIMSFSA
jgi:hypothetical protein